MAAKLHFHDVPTKKPLSWLSLLAVLACGGTAYAQETTMLARVEALELPFIGSEVNAYHSQGYYDRASTLQELAEEAARLSYVG